MEAKNNWWGSPDGPIYYSDCKKDHCDAAPLTWSQGDRDAIHTYNQREVLYQPFASEKIVY